MINVEKEMREESKRIKNLEQTLGKGAMQPFSNTNSSSRKIMQSNQLEQAISLLYPEVPIVSTGYENEYGDLSSSIIELDSNIEIIDKISKFENKPNEQYYLIYRNLTTGEFDFLKRESFYHSTEAYGYLYNNDTIDSIEPGFEVPKGTIVRKSRAYDQYMNRCDGVNLLTGYVNCNKTMEDGILISQTAARKLASPLIKEVEVTINDNDILLNLFGDSENGLKSFPDIGEYIPAGILCAIRREKTDECLYMQSIEQLSNLLISDTKYTVTGRIMDIDIYCNSPEVLEDRYCNYQVKKYYYDHKRMIREVINCVDNIYSTYGKNAKISYKLKELYHRSIQEENGNKFFKDKPFSGTKLVFYVLEENVPVKGDKITNRYGGKGVISEVIPDEEMPMLETGEHMEVCFNGSTCVNRLNWGQLGEESVTFIGRRLIEYMCNNPMDTTEVIDMMYKYISFISKKQADFFINTIYDENMSAEDREMFIDQLFESGDIYISNDPMSESMSIDILREMYSKLPFIDQYKVYTMMKDSNGRPRMVLSKRKITCGKMYIYRLKQYAEEKFSVTSLSSTNIKNENTRNKADKFYRSLHSNTPIRFGEMETEDFMHMGVEHVISTLMIHSVSPQARRLTEEMLTGDPYHVDIVLDDKSKNRSVEILNTYLKTIGLKIVFEKVKKKKKNLIEEQVLVQRIESPIDLVKRIHPDDLRYLKENGINLYDRDKKLQEEADKYMVYVNLVERINEDDKQ